MPKLIRITTVPISLHKLIKGQPNFMQSHGFDVKLLSADGKEIPLIKKETGLDVKVFPYTREISPIADLKALWLTYKFFKKEKPEIVHTHTPKAGIVGMLAAKLAGVPIRLHTVAGLPLMEARGLKRKVLNFVERLTSWSATNVYPNSYALKEFMEIEQLAQSSKLKVVGNGSSNGIDTEWFSKAKVESIKENVILSGVQRSRKIPKKEDDIASTPTDSSTTVGMTDDTTVSNVILSGVQRSRKIPRKEEDITSPPTDSSTTLRSAQPALPLGRNDDNPKPATRNSQLATKKLQPATRNPQQVITFCFVGRIVKDKGINELLSAFEKLSKENENVELLLVGPEERELDPISSTSQDILESNKNIISVGWQEDVRPFLAQSDVFVFPSYREGFPNVVMQAGAMELPCIVSNINGSNEIIKDGVNGVIIPVKDENAIYDKMKLLADDAELRDKLAKPARKMIIERYEQKFVWKALLKEYNRLLRAKGVK